MRFILGIFLIMHGIAHLVGFAVPWRIIQSEDSPYKTTLLSRRVDIGDIGIRLVGIAWLVAAFIFIVAGAGLILQMTWWEPITLYVSMGSLVLSVLGWPESRIGVILNLAILGFLGIGSNQGWLPEFN